MVISRVFQKICIKAWVLWCTIGFAVSVGADDTICINETTSQPTLDGEIEGDQFWHYSSQYAFLNGTSEQHGRVQLLRDASNLYVSFEINKLPAFNANTAIILLIGPDPNDPGKDYRIHLYPGSDSGADSNSPPRRIVVWKNSTAWTQQVNCEPAIDTNCSTSTSFVEAKVTAAYGAENNNAYRVEMRIKADATGLSLPAIGTDIKLAFNALRVYTHSSGGITETFADQLNWPTNGNIPGGEYPLPSPNPINEDIMANPERANWGTASQVAWGWSCPGVQVKRAWINTTATPSTLAAPAPGATSVTNVFHVEVENTGSTGAGNVLGTINSWRFGSVPYSLFGKIGPPNVGTVSPGNPVSSYDGTSNPIGAGQTRKLQPMSWTLTDSEYQDLYHTNPLVCSLVELDVDSAHVPTDVLRTQIPNRHFPWNIHMAPASVFKHKALLESRGYPASARYPEEQRFELFTSTQEIARRVDDGDARKYQSAYLSNNQVDRKLDLVGGLPLYREGAGFFVKTVCPYRHTGRYIQVNEQDVELLERAPCFEYWVYHLGDLREWVDFPIRGPDGPLSEFGANHSTVSMGFNQSIELETQIEAVEAAESGPYAVGIHGGVTDPQSSFGNDYNGRFAGDVFFEYKTTNNLAIEATLGLHRFDGKGAVKDIDVTQLAVNGKWYLPQQQFKPFVTLGAGAYSFDPGSVRLGGNVGAGVQVDIAPRWSVEGRYTLHAIGNNSPNSRYSTLLFGLRYEF